MAGDARLRLRIDVDSTNAERGLNSLQTGLSNLSSRLKSGLVVAAKAGATALATLATVGTVAGVKYNATLEQSSVAWTTLLGSASKAQDMLQRISKFAAATPFETTDVDQMAKYLHNAGYEGDALFDSLMKVSDTASAFAVPADAAVEMVRQMSQVRQAGTAYTEDLNVLADRGIPIYQALSKQMGVSVADVKKMASEGKISADVYMKAFDGIAGSVKGASDAQSQTFNGMISTLKDNLDILAGALSKPIFDALKAGMDKVLPALQNFVQLIRDKGLSAALMSLVPPGLQPILQSLGDGIKTLWDHFQQFFQSIGGAQAIFSALGGAFSFIQGVIMGYIGFVKQLFSGDNNLGNSFMKIFNTIKSIAIPILQDAVAFIKSIIAQLTAFWNENGAMIIQAVQNLWAGVAAVFQFIAPVLLFLITMIWDSIKGVIQGALNIIMGLVKIFAGLFTGNWGAMWDGIKQLFFGAVEFLWNLMNLMFIGKIFSAIKGFFTAAIDLAKLGWSLIKDNWKVPIDAIWKFVEDFLSAVVDLFNLFKARGASTFEAFWGVVKSLWNSAISGIKSVAQGFADGISAIWNGMKSTASSVWNAISSTAISIWNGIKNGVMAVVNGWRNILDAAWNGMSSSASAIWNGIKGAVTGIVDFLKADVTGKFDAIKSAASSIFNGIKTVMTSPIEAAKGVIMGIIDTIKGAFSAMHIKIPSIKLPHVTIAMKTGVMGIPYPDFNVNWYKTGGVFDGASMIGVGEAGPEAVVPLSGPRMAPFADAIAKRLGGGNAKTENNFHIAQLIVREEADIQRIARELKNLQDRKNR